jgi:GntR family transcriptional regulator
VDVTRAGRTPRAKLLEAKTCPASGQLQATLRLDAGQKVHQIRRLRVTPIPDQAALLAVHDGTPAIMLDRTAVDSTGRPVEFARDLYRADRASFRVGAQLSIHPPLR